MKLNYKKLGDYIQQVTIKNKDCIKSKKSLYQILCKLFNFRIPSQIYLKQASSF